jgi:energy-converting hydrogenase A subunit M
MMKIDQLPQFDVQQLLEGALQKLDASDLGGLHSRIVQAARNEIAAALAAHLTRGDEKQNDAEQSLRRTAKSLMSVRNPQVESARLAIMSAADMLRDT